MSDPTSVQPAARLRRLAAASLMLVSVALAVPGDAVEAAVDNLPPGAPAGAHHPTDGGYLPSDWNDAGAWGPTAEYNLRDCATYESQPGEVNDPPAADPPSDPLSVYVRCNGLGDRNEGDDPADGLVQITNLDDPENEHAHDGRWVGAYAVGSARTDGPGSVMRIGYCLMDSAGHPSPIGGQVVVTAADKQARGFVTSPVLDYALWRFGNTYDDVNAAGLWTVVHYLQGDQSAAGETVVTELANATDSTAINNRAVAIYAASVAKQGPWTVMVDVAGDGTSASVAVSGPGGPISNEAFSVAVSGASGAPQSITTDTEGRASFPLTPTGGPVTVTVSGVGPSPYIAIAPPQGSPDAQWLASAGPGLPVTGSDTANPGWIRVVKTVGGETADVAYTSPDGTLLELRDSTGVSLGQRTVSGGVANWGPIDTQAHPGPYAVFELDAAPGLVDPDPTVAIATLSAPPSGDPAAPSEIGVDNLEVQVLLVIEKAVDGLIPPGADLGGFQFEVIREDGQRFGSVAELTTSSSLGQTAQIQVTPGNYSVCEVGRPPWSLAIQPEPAACQALVVSSDGATPPVVFEFTNVTASCRAATQMAVRYASPGDQVVDRLWMADCVPGRQLRADLTWYRAAVDAEPSEVECAAEHAAFTGSATFTSAASETLTEIVGVLPADATNVSYWAAGRVVDVETGVVVHELGCGDPREMVAVLDIATTAPAVVDAGSAIHDTYTVPALPDDPTATISATFALHDVTATCDDASPLVGTITETITRPGEAVTTDGVVTGSGVFVFREVLTVDYTVEVVPPGFSMLPTGSTDTVELTWSSTPEPCEPAETTWAVSLITQVRDAILSGQPSVDEVFVSGLPSSGLGPGESAELRGGLYQHPTTQPLSERTCTDANRVGSFGPLPVTGNGTILTPGLTGYPKGVDLSYNETLTITRVREIAGQPVTTTWTSTSHGCQIATQTQYSQPPSTSPTTTLASPTTPVRRAAGPMPATGSNTTSQLVVALGLLGVGTAALLAARRRAVMRV